jgi:hypothetical protein
VRHACAHDDEPDNAETGGATMSLVREIASEICRRFFRESVKDRDVSNMLEGIEDNCKTIERAIDGKPGDPGPLWPLHERVARVAERIQGD